MTLTITDTVYIIFIFWALTLSSFSTLIPSISLFPLSLCLPHIYLSEVGYPYMMFVDRPMTYLYNTLHYYEHKLRDRPALKKKLVQSIIGIVHQQHLPAYNYYVHDEKLYKKVYFYLPLCNSENLYKKF